MINSALIYKKANQIVTSAGTRNPVRIANHLGIDIYFEDDYKNLLGMYTNAHRKRAMFINSRMEEYMMHIVIAHEVGHDTLHRDLAKNNTLQEFVLFDMKDTTEYDANAFASHLLIDTEEFISMAHEGYDLSHIASVYGVNINLLLIKTNELIKLGYDLRLPQETRGDFLKNITV